MNETEAKLCVCEEESESQNGRAEEKLQCGALQWPAALCFQLWDKLWYLLADRGVIGVLVYSF